MSERTKAESQSEWQRRTARAEELGSQYSFAAEVLRFYAAIARFQGDFYQEIAKTNAAASGLDALRDSFAGPLPAIVVRPFNRFLSIVEQNGPDALREIASELTRNDEDSHARLLTGFWSDAGLTEAWGAEGFFAKAFLQPYAAALRSKMKWNGSTPYVCPFCGRKPGLGVLRPLGEGGLRSLVCSFCLAEWEFRRIVCPGCGEEDPAKLPVYTAEELKHVRVEACESCRTYIKTVDMTQSGRAEPVVDELAAIPLDLWAQKQGYTKLQANLMQL